MSFQLFISDESLSTVWTLKFDTEIDLVYSDYVLSKDGQYKIRKLKKVNKYLLLNNIGLMYQ